MELFYECGKGRGRKCYYVFPQNVLPDDALKEVAKRSGHAKKNYKAINVYVVRNFDGNDYLYLEDVPNSELMIGVVKQ